MFQERPVDAATQPSTGRLVRASTEIIVNTIGCLLAEDSSLTQCQIAVMLDILQKTASYNKF